MALTVELDAGAMALRVGAALVAGAVVGIDRELKRKPAGMRTHALVAIGACVVVLLTIGQSAEDPDAVSRAIQGIITGVGFLGAGVIMQREAEGRVEGLTTAASIWVTSALGMACGAGQLDLVLIALIAAVLVMVGGESVERRLTRMKRPREGPPEAR
ncbi:MAG TPA: MgtC/SapB family protein [Usitatibacter sp.]|nr:MgtC/SapB family protein [Usitatibacter sp.]